MKTLLGLLTLVCVMLPADSAWAGRMAFIDPGTGELKAHGFVEQNAPGDLAMSVPDDFSLEPHRWQWNGSTWLPFTPAPSQVEQDMADAKAKLDDAAKDVSVPPKVRAALDALRKALR